MPLNASTGEYGDAVADHYDNFYRHREDQFCIADYCKKHMPGAKTVLEFGVGQGRLAIPLAKAGFSVTGIDSSQRMLDRLAKATVGLDVTGVRGDFTTPIELGTFDIVIIGNSTLFMVVTQEGQMATLQQAAEYLSPDGRLIIDTYDPFTRMAGPRIQSLAFPCGEDAVMIYTVRCEPSEQRLYYLHQIIGPSGIQAVPELSRWSWPSELDLMAKQSGLMLHNRDADMKGTPWTGETENIVSVYTRSLDY